MESKLKCVFENPVIKTLAFEAVKSEATTDNGKNKGVGDFVKSSPKVIINITFIFNAPLLSLII